ncbi:hypothetical protein OG496_06320 [Streptomyces sp. NBC_00988]|uniref:hypothetical protein n=1 Tax=Streptomyces sp. NBC_00988 TaxID=2903704 RepID=UPI00386DA1FC|nr:hypothetical protein OG496_06320 [Streptomyces sp. NBC_00988]
MSPAPSIGVLATGTCLPERVLTNDEVAEAAGVDPDWIGRRGRPHRRGLCPSPSASATADTA